MAKYVTVKYDGVESRLDAEKLTFAEARAIEKVSGIRFAEIEQGGIFANMDTLQAMVWVAIKRSRPGFKFSDLDDVPMSDIEFTVEDDDEPGDDAADPQSSADSEAAGD